MRQLILYIFFISNLNALAQETCNCQSDFLFVVEKIEHEHPGFSLNVNKDNIDVYNRFKDSLMSATGILNTKTECQKNIKKYLNFIKDKHLQIYDPVVAGELAYEQNFLKNKNNFPQFQNLEDGAAYIKIPSFNYRLWKELDNFYDSITPILKSKSKIILDVRNNGGGGERMYNQLIKILKSNSKRAKVGIIFNSKCASACEEVALIVTNIKGIKTFGENTNGQFAYGFIKGYKTPECGFTFITTTKKYSERLKYEYIGIAPEIKLENESESDWIKIVAEKLDQ